MKDQHLEDGPGTFSERMNCSSVNVGMYIMPGDGHLQ